MKRILNWAIPSPWDLLSLLLNYGPALAAAVVTFGSGYYQSIPLVYLVPTTLVSAASLAVIVNSLSEWRERRRVRGRLIFGDVAWFADPAGLQTLQTGMSITAVQFGLILANVGNFPIHFEFRRFDATFSGRAGSEAVKTNGVVMPNRPSKIRSPRVSFNPPIVVAQGAVEDGYLVFEVSYGRAEGRLKHRIAHRVHVTAMGVMASGPLELGWVYDEDKRVIEPSD